MGFGTDPNLSAWVILPLLTFVARIADVTLGTIRIIFVNRGKKTLAPLLGFLEVFIWVSVISQIVRGAQNIAASLACAIFSLLHALPYPILLQS